MCDIKSWPGRDTLTPQQQAGVLQTLKDFHVLSVERVEYRTGWDYVRVNGAQYDKDYFFTGTIESDKQAEDPKDIMFVTRNAHHLDSLVYTDIWSEIH